MGDAARPAVETARQLFAALPAEARQTLAARPRTTIRPDLGAVRTGEHQAIERLAGIRDRAEALAYGATLGQGGMGLVREATQLSVGRPVAVKTLRPHITSEAASVALLQEGWLTGALEHPNVVPVHDMGVDDTGRPFVVLKRIAGDDWGQLIAAPDEVRRRFEVADPLVWHLETLGQVARAVDYAHRRGIIHRDLKPDNVRIGSHGEVYLLDWGIAVSLSDDAEGRLPLARDVGPLAGTPCYMAPEMLDGHGERLSPRTDVYLLGALLYELLYGRPPHQGDTAMKMLMAAAASAPDFPAGPPDELVALCRAALAKEPTDRPPSAEAFALALRRHLRHRDALRLAAAATKRLEALEAAEDEASVHRLFGECRFGFLQALQVWPGDADAAAGLQRALRWMIERELDHGRPAAAHPLLGELAEPDAELAARVDAALAEEARRRAEAEHLRAQHDPGIGTRTRSFFALVFGGVWTIVPLTGAYPAPFERAVYGQVALLVMAFGFLYWARESMMRTVVNRRIGVMLIATLLETIALQGMLAAMDAPWDLTLALIPFGWALMTVATVLAAERLLWPSLLAFLAASVATAVWPDGHRWFYAAANGTLCLNGVAVWHPRSPLARPTVARAAAVT